MQWPIHSGDYVIARGTLVSFTVIYVLDTALFIGLVDHFDEPLPQQNALGTEDAAGNYEFIYSNEDGLGDLLDAHLTGDLVSFLWRQFA